ncbi:hypothetical protein OIO90_002747 [Microbotryomycetes sp. JL221]|nr:hypothetical protein OIO90_002747 [Microbotryomycetes sp. JL221]
MSSNDLNDLIPATSPLLLPSRHPQRQDPRRRRSSTTSSLSITQHLRNSDIPDDLEFMAPTNWSSDDLHRSQGQFDDDDDEDDNDDNDDDDDDSDSLEDFTLEDGHIQGVPCCNVVLKAKQYRTQDFHQLLLDLLRDDLNIPGWSDLPADLPSSLVHIHKVSGSLTNAVFFVSIPNTTFQVNSQGVAEPLDHDDDDDKQHDTGVPIAPVTPSSFLTQLDQSRQQASSTPTPDKVAAGTRQHHEERTPAEPAHMVLEQGQQVMIEAPTVLLRVYGPSSGSLISRRTELHILHTLSSRYGIGPRVLGTFANGRVEEYFHSRALKKEEMRDARVSRWIGRRMRELHRVELDQVLLSDDDDNDDDRQRSRSASEQPERPSLERMGKRQGSTASIYSTSSGSSIFSFGTSYSSYSTSSVGSLGSMSSFGTPLVNSPLMMPQRHPSESRAQSKKRGKTSLPPSRSRSSSHLKRSKDKLGAWDNITRWTRQAKLVFKQLDNLANEPGFAELLQASNKIQQQQQQQMTSNQHVLPLASLSQTIQLRHSFDLPSFERQVKAYRSFVKEWERNQGKSKRVFSHNDTQYGNLLLLTPKDSKQEQDLEKNLQAPHQRIIVVDFEYASANPRGFDIANHFIEWQADYHHETMSHALNGQYPDPVERARFLRAYVGCDQGLDTPFDPPVDVKQGYQEDQRVVRLEQEVKVWSPASHAMWAVWGIVQAKEDLQGQIEKWTDMCRQRCNSNSQDVGNVTKGVEAIEIGQTSSSSHGPKLTRTKSGDVVVHSHPTKDDTSTPQDLSTTPHGDLNGNSISITSTMTMSDLIANNVVDEADVELFEQEPVVDFDYLSYSLGRVSLFRQEARELGCIDT